MHRTALKINFEKRSHVLEPDQFLTSSYKFITDLSSKRIFVSDSTIQGIIRDEKKKENRKLIKKEKAKNPRSLLVHYKRLVSNVALEVKAPYSLVPKTTGTQAQSLLV